MAPKPAARFPAPISPPGARFLRDAPLRFLSRWRLRGPRVGSFELPLVPLIDVLLGIVLFLISSFHAAHDCSCIDDYVDLPKARHVRDLVEAPVVVVTRNVILVDGVMAGTTRDAEPSGPPRRMAAIFNIMKNKRELWEQINPGKPFPGATLLKIDRHVPMGVLRSVLQTVALAGYPSISFMVQRRG